MTMPSRPLSSRASYTGASLTEAPFTTAPFTDPALRDPARRDAARRDTALRDPAFRDAPSEGPVAVPPRQFLRAVGPEDALGLAGPDAPPPHGVHVDAVRRAVHVDGAPVELTYLEFELLAHLVANPYRVHTRNQLISTVWGYGHAGDGRTVDVHVARLRRKLGAAHRASIVTVRRVGYKYEPAR